MHAENGATRIVILKNRLGASRDSLRTAMRVITELELIKRNPGYGHPLRPEYVLTESGQAIAAACSAYATIIEAVHADEIGYRKWTASLLRSLGVGCHRYSTIQADLSEITPRALSTSLRSLSDAGLIRREIEGGYPPRAVYRLSDSGIRAATAVSRIIDQLAALEPLRSETATPY